MLAGCGGDGDDDARSTAPTATATPTSTATATATSTATPTAFAPSAPEPPTDAPEDQEGGAGDEEPVRQRVQLTLREDGIRPRRVQVNAFLGIRFVIRNTTARERLVSVVGARPPRALAAGPAVQATLDIEGLRPGRYRIRSEPGGSALLVVDRPTP